MLFKKQVTTSLNFVISDASSAEEYNKKTNSSLKLGLFDRHY